MSSWPQGRAQARACGYNFPRPVGHPTGRTMQASAAFRGQSVNQTGAECWREPHSTASQSADQAWNACMGKVHSTASRSHDRARNAGECCVPWPVGQPTGPGMKVRTAFHGQSVSRLGAECRHSAASRSADQMRNAGKNRIPRLVGQPTARRMHVRISADRAWSAGGNRIPHPVGQPTGCGMQVRTAFRGQLVS